MADATDVPYVGPRPFEREDRALFFGRDKEAAALSSLVIAHQVVLLYAQSGAGKSSLLNADVAPRLQARGFEVFAGMRVSGDLPEGVSPTAVRNIYVYNALSSLAQSRGSRVPETATTIGEYLRAIPYPATTAGGASIRVLVLDQFEEVFTAFSERWKDRGEFFDDLGAALEEDPRLRVVLAMREEFIGGLDTHADRLPERLRTRFRLERLGPDAALLAVTRPLETTERSFAPEAARTLIENLLKVPIKSATGITDVSGEYVEPLHLQLVCTKLWKSLPSDVKVIDTKYIENLGDVDDALAVYYESCIAQVVKQTRTNEGTLRAWFERKLITPDGLRGIVPKGALTTGGLPNDIVDRLQKLYLIRIEMRGVNPWYELTHDRFVGPIRRSNQHWRDTAGADEVNTLEIEARADRWVRDGKPQQQLLSGSELAHANELLNSPEVRSFGISEGASEFVRTSGLQSKRRWLTGGAAGVTLLAVSLSGWALYLYGAKQNAEDAKISAHADVARKFASQRGLEFDALAYGMRAVGPRLTDRSRPPEDALDGLRAALKAVGNDIRLRGHAGPAIDVALSPDGKRALATSKDSICAWEAATGRLLFKCLDLPKSGSAPDVQFSPDRRWIYKRSRPGVSDTARLWNGQTGAQLLDAAISDTRNMGFSEDGNWGVAQGADAQMKVVDLAAGEVSRSFRLPGGDISSVAVSPNGNFVAIVTLDNAVTLWNTKTGRPVAAPLFAGGADGYIDVAYSADGQRIGVTAVKFDGRAQSTVWSLASGAPEKEGSPIEFVLPPGRFGVKFSPDGRRLATLTADTATLWDVQQGTSLGTYALTDAGFAALLEDGRVLVGHSQQNEKTKLGVFDIRTGKQLKDRTVDGELVAADASDDLTRFLTAGKDGVLRVNPLDAEVRQLDEPDPSKLFHIACEKYRHQQEFQALEEEIKRSCGFGT